MKKITPLLASLPLVVTACGGGGSSDTTANNNNTIDINDLKGTWSNDTSITFTSASGPAVTIGPSVGLLTSNNKIKIITGDIKAFTIDANGTSGHYYPSFTYSTPVAVQLSEQNNTLSVRLTNTSRNIDATISLSKNNTYSRTSSLAKLSAIWDDTYYTTFGNWNFNINMDGSFNANATTCTATGNFTTIDPAVNEYEITMTISNCLASGSYTGIAYLADTVTTDDTLVIMTSNGTGAGKRALGFKARRQ